MILLWKKIFQIVKLTVYEWGKHGFGMVDNYFMKTFHWNESLKEWLKEISIIE